MSTGEITVPSDSFNQRTDMNIQPTQVNVTLGNIPQHWLATQPLSRRDLKTNALTDVSVEPASEKHKIMRFEAEPNTHKILRFEEYGNDYQINK